MTTYDLANVIRAYEGSDGGITSSLFAELETLGPIGAVAVNLFRACKSSERAKEYRGRGFKGAAYYRKQWAMDNLCQILTAEAPALGMCWGWNEDDKQPFHRHVLYVDLPTGQVSFHTAERGAGPNYSDAWDGKTGQAADRICRWIVRLFRGDMATSAPTIAPYQADVPPSPHESDSADVHPRSPRYPQGRLL